MSATDKEEARAEAWLRAQGYTPSRPTWLPRGLNPDFWAENVTLAPPHLWAEVKSIDPDKSTAALERYSGVIGGARIPSGLHGHAMMELDPEALSLQQSVQWVLKSFARRSVQYVGKKVSLMFLQQTQDCDKEYRIEIEGETPMVIWARADELPLNPATAIESDMLHANALMRTPDRNEIRGPAYQFFRRQHAMQCALVLRLDPRDRVLESIGCMCSGEGQTRKRTVSALESANRQIKTACGTRDAPGLVILTPQGPFGNNVQMIQAAIYGQYTVPVRPIGERVELGDMYHGRDGVFRRDKNRHISAAVHVRRDGSAAFFPNPYARHHIPDDAQVFAGAVRANVDAQSIFQQRRPQFASRGRRRRSIFAVAEFAGDGALARPRPCPRCPRE
jgi:hypothetical protein